MALKDANEIKIFILLLLKQVNYPLEFADVNDIVVQDGVVNYFDFVDCFAELLEAGNIAEIQDNGVKYFGITPQGVHVAENLRSSIPSTLREKSMKSALRLLSFKSRGAYSKCEYRKRDDGKYSVDCEIGERGELLMKIEAVAENENQAVKMKYRFDGDPEMFYRGILSLFDG